MTTLSANLKRTYEFNADPVYNDIPMVASDILWEGSAVGENSSTGNARPLVAADTFLGFNVAKRDNASGSIGDITARVRQKGTVKLTVTNVSADDDFGISIYALDDNDFTTTASGASAIGKLVRWVSGTTCMVAFEAAQLRSI